MSRDRLEEIVNRYADALLNDGYFNDTITITSKDYLQLVEQVERVQELEGILDQDARQGMLEDLYAENKRYREALEFYADFYKYNYGGDKEAFKKVGKSIITKDSGEKARKALEGEGC